MQTVTERGAVEHIEPGAFIKHDEYSVQCPFCQRDVLELFARLRGEATVRVELCTCSVMTGGHIAGSPACPIHRPATVRVEDDVCVYCREPRAKHTKEGHCVARFVNIPASLEDQP